MFRISADTVYEPEAEALFTRMTALGETPTDARKAAINEFIYQEKLCGNWSKRDVLYMAPHATNSAALNWVGDSLNIPSLTNLDVVVDRGITSTGTLTNLFGPSSLSQYARASAHVSIYIRTDGQSNVNLILCSDGNLYMRFSPRTTANQSTYRINDLTNVAASNSDARGMYDIIRIGAMRYLKKNNQLLSESNISNTTPLGLFRFDVDTVHQISFVSLGSSAINFEAQYKNVQQYLTALGAAV